MYQSRTEIEACGGLLGVLVHEHHLEMVFSSPSPGIFVFYYLALHLEQKLHNNTFQQ